MSNERKYRVSGMSCAACAANIERCVRKVEGVSQVVVNLLTNQMLVTPAPDAGTDTALDDRVCRAVSAAGYSATPETAEKTNAESIPASGGKPATAEQEMLPEKHRLLLSILFLLPLMYIAMAHHMTIELPLPEFLSGEHNALSWAFTQFLLTLPILYINRIFFIRGFRALFHAAPNMDTLIAVGSAAGVVYGIVVIYQLAAATATGDWETVARCRNDLYFEAAAMILTLITLGKFLEARSRRKTGDAIAKLMQLAPQNAVVERDGAEITLPIEQLVPGDIVLVRPGGSIPVDGVITAGDAAVDQSALTGESIPVDKHPGDRVIAATINRSGFLKIRAERVGEETTLAQIIQLVEDAGNSRAPIAALADRVSGIFVPVVIAIALLASFSWLFCGATVTFAISIGIAVLVVSCPCALGLATPVAIMVGTGRGAQAGILFKTADALERAGKIDTVALDKTGTVTCGEPRVTDVLPASGVTKEGLLAIAAALEKPSEHPLACAIVQAAADQRITPAMVTEFQAIPGRGVRGAIDSSVYLAGNAAMLAEAGFDPAPCEKQAAALSVAGKTPLFFAGNNRILGIIALADTIKPTSREAIAAFRSLGIDVVMLTGDNQRCAEAIQKELGIDRSFADLLPQEKEAVIRELQNNGHKVAMVGDGINDAPALARADVGIAIGAGTDIAIDAADVVLIKNDLNDAAEAVALSRAVMRNIRENLFWAFFYNTLGIPLAAGVFFPIFGWKLSPVFGALAMSLSSICVVSNALRLRFFQPKFKRVTTARTADTETPSESPIIPADEPEKMVAPTVQKFHISGMSCNHCRMKAENALRALPGVTAAEVDLESGTAVVHAVSPVPEEQFIEAIKAAGFRAEHFS